MKSTTHGNRVGKEVELLLEMETLAHDWKWIRFLAYILGSVSMVQFVIYDPVAKQGSGIACFFAIPWLLGRALSVLREP